MMRLLIIFLIFLDAIKVYCQSNKPGYPPMCLDTIYMDTFKIDEPDRFFGGEDQLKKFLKVNIGKQVWENKIPAGQIILQVSIDTNGNTKNVSIISGMESCEACNKTILDTFKAVRRWKPYCYYAPIENIIICEDRNFEITIRIKDKEIYVGGD